jgi:putative Mg2+ transporter-C (MgtC) family protein
MNWLTIDTSQLPEQLAKIAIAFVLALPVAWDREKANRIMGMRTFPLVAMASCAYVLVGLSFITAGAADAQARIIQGLMTGIGFIGGGAILKENDRVIGTASAASIWITGAMGAAVAYDQYILAALLSVVNFAILRFFIPIKHAVDSENSDRSD